VAAEVGAGADGAAVISANLAANEAGCKARRDHAAARRAVRVAEPELVAVWVADATSEDVLATAVARPWVLKPWVLKPREQQPWGQQP
jgi:hypothetical protein